MIPDQKNSAPCPLCGCGHRAYVFSKNSSRVVRCMNCGLSEDIGFAAQGSQAAAYTPASLARAQGVFKGIREAVTLVTAPGGGKSLEAVCRGACGAGRIRIADAAALEGQEGLGGTVVVDDHLLDQPDPVAALRLIRQRMAAGQPIVLLVELVGGRQGRLGSSLAMRRAPARFWPDWSTLHKLLLAAQFEHIWLHNIEAEQHGSQLALVSARAAAPNPRPRLSVILPVYNERRTFEEALERVLAKDVPGIDMEVVIIESNSTDGTKEAVAKYQSHPKVRILWQDGPRGKGNAVREGMAAATGDIILIQDADLEYDVNDYDALVDELLSWRASFVLGSRHVGDWKLRKFNDMPVVASLFNMAHVFFVGVLNFLLGSGMKDPFTMYKVFYRDCLYGLNFWCDRFDYDHELVIKLFRKGFHPVEIPVNYQARSYSEGKKVSVIKDGLTWLARDIKLAAEPLDDPRTT